MMLEQNAKRFREECEKQRVLDIELHRKLEEFKQIKSEEEAFSKLYQEREACLSNIRQQQISMLGELDRRLTENEPVDGDGDTFYRLK